jgi:hypothetical protein
LGAGLVCASSEVLPFPAEVVDISLAVLALGIVASAAWAFRTARRQGTSIWQASRKAVRNAWESIKFLF